MGIFEQMAKHGHEQLIFCYDKETGLKAIIGIHDTTLGPALGGTRFWNYSQEEEAVTDVLRLSRGMTYKNAVMGLNLGGGKAVIWGDAKSQKSEALFRAYGRFIQSIGGRYITAEDVNTTVADMKWVEMETAYVAGRGDLSGDPSPVTAYGTLRGMKAAAKWRWGDDSLLGKRVAVQGLGKVGFHLCELLRQEGALLTVTDINPQTVQRAVDELGATVVGPDEIYGVDCDIYAPCALGATLNDSTIPQLRCQIVAGSANNQLQESRHAAALKERGILYCPDFVINGGGVVNVAQEFHPHGYSRERALAQVGQIYDKLLAIFQMAAAEGITTAEAANRLAEARIHQIHAVHRIYVPE
jgi:leucine dehydrogenase